MDLGFVKTPSSAEISVGVYEQYLETNDYLITAGYANASGTISMVGGGVEANLASAGISRNICFFGKPVSLGVEANLGIGAKFSVGSKTEIGFSFGLGLSISTDWDP